MHTVKQNNNLKPKYNNVYNNNISKLNTFNTSVYLKSNDCLYIHV